MDMSRRFNTYIDIPEVDFWRTFCMEQGVLRHFEKGEDFATVGEVCRYVGFIKSGTLKYLAFSSDGCEHVVGMEFAGEFVADFPFSFYGTPSRVSITAQSPCDIYCVSVKVIAERMRDDRFLSDIIMHSTEAVFSTVYDRYMALYTRSAHERYRDLINRHPDLFTLFSLKDIASFLNITPTHLSRLRKNS